MTDRSAEFTEWKTDAYTLQATTAGSLNGTVMNLIFGPIYILSISKDTTVDLST